MRTVWRTMVRRCTDPRVNDYERYGGRGISVCERWRVFAHFLADMGVCAPGFQLDRIDNNGDYEPSNCRWVTRLENMAHTRASRVIEWGGTAHTLSEWGRITGLGKERIYQRLKRGWSVEQTMTVGSRGLQ